MHKSCLLKGQGTLVTGEGSRLQHSHFSLVIKRQEVRHGKLRRLGRQILKTAFYLFVGIEVFLGGPEKTWC